MHPGFPNELKNPLHEAIPQNLITSSEHSFSNIGTLALKANNSHSSIQDYYKGWGIVISSPTGEGIITSSSTSNPPTISVTWDNQLPAGRYQVISAGVITDQGYLFRVILANQIPRPGGLAISGFGSRNSHVFSPGYLGSWGEFESFVMPGIELFSETTTATHDVYLTIVKIS